MPVTFYAHLTWTTLERRPLIDRPSAVFLRGFLPKVARRHGATVITTGIVSDHVHVVLHLPPVLDIPRLVQGLKGASARIANRDGHVHGTKLRWADGYDMRSVSPRALERVVRYVEAQAVRHPLAAIPKTARAPTEG